VAGLAKDPEDAGRIIAAALTQAAAPVAPAKAPEAKATPEHDAGPKSEPEDRAQKPQASTPKVAE
jgi:hypothetical protein